MGNRPLFDGLKVIDCASWLAGPVAATILADMGADVVKVEIPGAGDPYRNFAWLPGTPKAEYNYTWTMDARNKRSITLDLKSEAGREVLRKLVTGCDVYITNQIVAKREEFGLTYEDLRPLNPRMIFAAITAYGETGPERDREGFDAVAYWARSGLQDLVRSPGSPPGASVAGMGDHPTSISMYAAIVTALYRRQITGEGAFVHTSLLANGYWANGCMGSAALAGADFEARRQRTERGFFTHRLYETADGRYLQFNMVRSSQDQETLLREVGLGSLLDDTRFATAEARVQNNGELAKRLRERIRDETLGRWLRHLGQAGLPVSHLAVVEDMHDDVQAKLNGVLVEPTDDRVPARWIINHPINVEGSALVGPSRSPEPGEHNDEILKGLGFTIEDIELLRDSGVITDPVSRDGD